jgi:thiol-disulfide isomerase/thioredoxin
VKGFKVFLLVAAASLVGLLLWSGRPAQVGNPAPEFPRAQWLNGPPLTLRGLRGKVVLVDFWEYTCINCIRTLPYLKEWYKRYAPYGLVIVGVHTPEFRASSIPSNVEAAVRRFGITYPVLLDDRYKTWNAYGNLYWPRDYLIDRKGVIRFDHVGEGGYGRTEEEIQSLLREGGTCPNLPIMAPVRATDQPGAVCYLTTPEIYVGSSRGHLSNRGGYAGIFGGPGGEADAAPHESPGGPSGAPSSMLSPMESSTSDRRFSAPPPDRIEDGLPALDGLWEPRGQYCQSGGAFSKLFLQYHAAGCYVVADAGKDRTEARMEVLLDGKPVPPALRGEDVQEHNGVTFVRLGRTRLYRLVGGNVFGRHLLELEPPAGARIYSFTFGTCTH